MSGPREPNRLPFRVDSDEQIIAIETLTPYLKSRMIGGILINWHKRNGTWQMFKPAAREVIIALAFDLGVAKSYSVGLVFEAEAARETIAERSCLSEGTTYRTFDQLIDLGAMRMFETNVHGRRMERFELIMPPEPWDWDPAKELSLSIEPAETSPAGETEIRWPAKNPLPSENEIRWPAKNSLASEFSDPSQPLQNTDLRAPARKNSLASEKITPVQNAKSDSQFTSREDSLASEKSHIYKIYLSSYFKSYEAQRQGKSVSLVLQTGGMRPKQADTLARDPNAKFSALVLGAIQKCDQLQASDGLRKTNRKGEPINLAESREQYIFAHVRGGWAIPAPEHERQLEQLDLPEHETESIALALEAERSDSPGGQGAATAQLLAPLVNPRLASLANDLVSAAPNAQVERIALQTAAEAAKRAVMNPRTFTPIDRRRILGSLNPDRRQKLLDQVLQGYTPEQIAAWHPYEPMDMPAVINAVCELAEGGAI